MNSLEYYNAQLPSLAKPRLGTNRQQLAQGNFDLFYKLCNLIADEYANGQSSPFVKDMQAKVKHANETGTTLSCFELAVLVEAYYTFTKGSSSPNRENLPHYTSLAWNDRSMHTPRRADERFPDILIFKLESEISKPKTGKNSANGQYSTAFLLDQARKEAAKIVEAKTKEAEDQAAEIIRQAKERARDIVDRATQESDKKAQQEYDRIKADADDYDKSIREAADHYAARTEGEANEYYRQKTNTADAYYERTIKEADATRENAEREAKSIIEDAKEEARKTVSMNAENSVYSKNKKSGSASSYTTPSDITESAQQRANEIISNAENYASEIETEARRYAKETRQKADQYAANIQKSAETQKLAASIVQSAEERANQTMAKANEYYDAKRKKADVYSEQIRQDADNYAEAIRKEADDYIEQIRQDAASDAEATREDAEIQAKSIRVEAKQAAKQTLQDAEDKAAAIMTRAKERAKEIKTSAENETVAMLKATVAQQRAQTREETAAIIKSEIVEHNQEFLEASKSPGITQKEMEARAIACQQELLAAIDQAKATLIKDLNDWKNTLHPNKEKLCIETYLLNYQRFAKTNDSLIAVLLAEINTKRDQRLIDETLGAELVKKLDKLSIYLEKFLQDYEVAIQALGFEVFKPQEGDLYDPKYHRCSDEAIDEEPIKYIGCEIESFIKPGIKKININGEEEVLVFAEVVIKDSAKNKLIISKNTLANR